MKGMREKEREKGSVCCEGVLSHKCVWEVNRKRERERGSRNQEQENEEEEAFDRRKRESQRQKQEEEKKTIESLPPPVTREQ